MQRDLLRDALGWGVILWLIGYILGVLFFFVVPPWLIGWVIMPIGVVVTVWVLLKSIKADRLQDYATLAVVWTALAVGLDYLFIVKALRPADGYYKLDVYLYYGLTFVMPLVAGWWKGARIARAV